MIQPTHRPRGRVLLLAVALAAFCSTLPSGARAATAEGGCNTRNTGNVCQSVEYCFGLMGNNICTTTFVYYPK